MKIILNAAKTPIQRIGLLVLMSCALVFVLTAIHWNLTKKSFIYKEIYVRYEQISAPEDPIPQGTTWRNSKDGWALIDDSCSKGVIEKRGRSLSSMIIYPPENEYDSLLKKDKCELKFVPHKRIETFSWRESFTSYIDQLFSENSDGYSPSGYFILISLLLGLFMFTGWAERLMSWVNNGSNK